MSAITVTCGDPITMSQADAIADMDGRFEDLSVRFRELWEMQARADWTDTSFKAPIGVVMEQMKFLVDAQCDLIEGRSPNLKDVQ